MNIPKKYEDVVAERDAALARETALREELASAYRCIGSCTEQIEEQQQRLTVVEAREFQLNRALGGMLFAYDDGVGRAWSAPLMDYARKLATAMEFRPVERNGPAVISNPATNDGVPAFAYCSAALKQAAGTRKCMECDSQYCHGVCVERGDDDPRFYESDAEGEGS